MKETIYTIPLSEALEARRGCPVCALAAALDERWVGYITGAAMMEPDVRVATNRRGFCARHLDAMLRQRNRLSVALLLQTRLETLLEQSAPKGKRGEEGETCFVCERAGAELVRLCDNLAAVWAREESFRRLYAEQEALCVPHHALLLQAGRALRGAQAKEFAGVTETLLRRGLAAAKADIDAFCRLFDHRSGGGEQPPERVARAVERAGRLLCGHTFAEE